MENTRPRTAELRAERRKPRCAKSEMVGEKSKQVIICKSDAKPEQTQSSAADEVPKHDKPISGEKLPRQVKLFKDEELPKCKRSNMGRVNSDQEVLCEDGVASEYEWSTINKDRLNLANPMNKKDVPSCARF